MRTRALLAALLQGAAVFAISLRRHAEPKILRQFPPGTWIENIAVRHSGQALLTQLTPEAALLSLSGSGPQSPSVETLHKFPSIDGLLGIAEPSPDVFAVVGSKFSGPGAAINGTAETWLVDFRPNSGGEGASPSIKRIGKHPQMVFPNGVTALPYDHNAVLISDSTLGVVWRVHLQSGEAEVAVQVPEMKPVPGSPAPIGVNGIKVRDGYLFWSNTFAGKIYRIAIDRMGNPRPNAPAEVAYRMPGSTPFIDDFVLDRRGIWGTTNRLNSVFHVANNGQDLTIAGSKDSLIVARSTACAFGRTGQDQKTLYVVTANVDAKDGQEAMGGKVVAIDTKSM